MGKCGKTPSTLEQPVIPHSSFKHPQRGWMNRTCRAGAGQPWRIHIVNKVQLGQMNGSCYRCLRLPMDAKQAWSVQTHCHFSKEAGWQVAHPPNVPKWHYITRIKRPCEARTKIETFSSCSLGTLCPTDLYLVIRASLLVFWAQVWTLVTLQKELFWAVPLTQIPGLILTWLRWTSELLNIYASVWAAFWNCWTEKEGKKYPVAPQ